MRLSAGLPAGVPSVWNGDGGAVPSSDIQYGMTSLSLVMSSPDLVERLSLLRSTAFYDSDLLAFARSARSMWALDVLASRLTRHGHDWASFRSRLLHANTGVSLQQMLDGVALDRLFALAEALHDGGLDREAERALVRHVVERALAGESITQATVEGLVERLLQEGSPEQARALLNKLTAKSWRRHSFAVELLHPRFGGDYSLLIATLNEPYRMLGLESVELAATGPSPFERLRATPQNTMDSGPLVTVIMTCRNPGDEILLASRSIMQQTYQRWELIVADDGSDEDVDRLAKIEALDPRVKVLRSGSAKGSFARRNEAIQHAGGELVTFQDADSWSHPHRLETQVRELLAHPTEWGNNVHAICVTEDLSMVGVPGADLHRAEGSLMFRREVALDTIGFFDTVLAGSGVEFRKRLEATSKRRVPALVPGVPLIFGLATSSEDAVDHSQFFSEDEQRYSSAVNRYIHKVEAGAATGYLSYPPEGIRAFDVPAGWVPQARTSAQQFDVMVVLDGRESSQRTDFHRIVAEELRVGAAAGLRIAVMQSDSLMGRPSGESLAPQLQDLINDGAIARVSRGEPAKAALVVVRHAGAVQGHPEERQAVQSEQVIIIEDPGAGDARGQTIARDTVTRSVASWFGVQPTWTRALPHLPDSAISSAIFDSAGLRLAIETTVASSVQSVRIANGSRTLDVDVSTSGTGVMCLVPNDDLIAGDVRASLIHDAGGGTVITRECRVRDTAQIWNKSDRLAVRIAGGGLRILDAAPVGELSGARDVVKYYLSASVNSVRVVEDAVEVVIATKGATYLLAVYAHRELESGVVRRRDFEVTTSEGQRVWTRPLAKFADSRWRIFGAFRTPAGVVEYPIRFDETAAIVASPEWAPQILSGDRILVAPPLPTRPVRAARKVSRAINDRFGGKLRKPARRRAEVRFGSRHAEPRVESVPTVSVVMPVYNVEPYLEAAITSVLEQEFRDLELIIVDDASKDDGRHIIEKYWRADPRVRVFALDHNTLGGAGIPSNIGIRAARGTYVAFADSDDQVTAGGLARLVALAETHEAELVIGDFQTFTDDVAEGTESYDRAVWAEIPQDRPVSAFTDPALFRLSPVPWRKLYRREFLVENGILYPEGDYFYEDNPLHWFVLSRAHRVVLTDEIVSSHRMEREGQTMSAQKYKLGAFVSHSNTILNFLDASVDEKRDTLFEAFFNYLDRTLWTATRQTQPAAAALIRRGFGEIYERAIQAAPSAVVPERTRNKLTPFRVAYPDPDLTIVIPVYNSSELLKPTLDSVLRLRGLQFDVLLIDDGSTDDSLAIMEEYEKKHDNIHVFSQGNRGAGRARNSVIPLCAGRYTFFLDADDVVRADALEAAVLQADEEAADLLFLRYGVEYTDEGRSKGMFDADVEVWKQLVRTTDNGHRQQVVARLINYPWNRIIRTSLLHDANIFFGPTAVHNDVLFHWHTITSARRIGYLDAEVCVHRKFATRGQVTNISDERRLSVVEALRGTHERIAFLESYPNVEREWQDFALHLLDWAKSRIPDGLQEEYRQRSETLMTAFS